MSLVDEQFEFLKDVAKLISFIESQGLKVTGGELYRTPEQQEIYVKTGRSRTMNSYHLRRLAIDLHIFSPETTLLGSKDEIQPVGAYWESLNPKNSWGGNWNSFKDLPHFERRG